MMEEGDVCPGCENGFLRVDYSEPCECGHPNASPPCSLCENRELICDYCDRTLSETYYDENAEAWGGQPGEAVENETLRKRKEARLKAMSERAEYEAFYDDEEVGSFA